jgi:succinoglycan biosynthesis transport protein ExoP
VTIQDVLRVLREQWLVVVLVVVVGTGAALGAHLVTPPEYTARLTLYVSAQDGDDSTVAAYQGAELSRERVTSYVRLVDSRRVASEVAARLGLGVRPEQLTDRISAASAVDSVLIDVDVRDGSAQSAATVANTVGDVFVGLVDELERPIGPDGRQAVAVRVVQPAVPPAEPSSIGLAFALVLGLLVGLAAGVTIALARAALDTSVRSASALRSAAGAPNLGTVAHDSKIPRRPLTMHDDPRSPRAEAFRQLRTNLQFVHVDNPPKVILVTSSMPAEGKTTTVTNLAIALASGGSRVLLVEGDLRRPKLADLLGVERAVGLTSVLVGRLPVEEVVQPWGGGLLDVLASGPLPPNPSELLASGQMQSLLERLRREYDVVLIDSPPLLPVADAAAVAPAADGVLLVCRYRQTSRGQVEASAAALRAVSARLLGTVFTMVPGRRRRTSENYYSYYRTDVAVEPVDQGVDLRPAVPGADADNRHSMAGER